MVIGWLLAGCAGPSTSITPSPPGPTGDTAQVWTGPMRCGRLDRVVHGAGAFAGQALARSPAGTLYAGGFFSGAATTWGTGATSTTLTPLCSGGGSGFLARFDVDGSLVWTRQLAACSGGASTSTAAVDATDGRVAVVVRAASLTAADTTVESGDTHPNVVLPGRGLSDAVVAAYDPEGRLVLAGSVGGHSLDEPEDVAVGPDGSVVVVGTFNSDDMLVTGTTRQLSLPLGERYDPVNEKDGFVAKWNPDGSLGWAQAMHGLGHKDPKTVDITDDGVVLVTGEFTRELVLAPGTPEETTWHPFEPTAPGSDGFLAGFDLDGKLLFSERIGDAIQNNFVRSGTWTGTELVQLISVNVDARFGLDEQVWPTEEFSQAVVRFTPAGAATGVRSVVDELASRTGLAIDARRDGWVAVGGFSITEWTFGTPPDQVSFPYTRGSPMILTWRPDGTEACAWPIVSDYPDFWEGVSGTVFDEDGGVWVVGSFQNHLTFVPDTPEERTLTNDPADGVDLFLARFVLQVPATTATTE